jgi:hypothetical protein
MACCRCGCRLRVKDLVPGARGLRCKAVATCNWRRQRDLERRQLAFDFGE